MIGTLRGHLEESTFRIGGSTDMIRASNYDEPTLRRSWAARMIGASSSGHKSYILINILYPSVASAYTRSGRPHAAYDTINTFLEEREDQGHECLDIALLNSALYACAEMGNVKLMERFTCPHCCSRLNSRQLHS